MMITPEEMREWTAKKMGWKLGTTSVRNSYTGIATHEPAWIDEHGTHKFFVVAWTPDTDLNQCFMLVDRMGELGWNLYISIPQKGFGMPYWPIDEVTADFQKSLHGPSMPPSSFERCNKSLAHAIILAAMATEEE